MILGGIFWGGFSSSDQQFVVVVLWGFGSLLLSSLFGVVSRCQTCLWSCLLLVHQMSRSRISKSCSSVDPYQAFP